MIDVKIGAHKKCYVLTHMTYIIVQCKTRRDVGGPQKQSLRCGFELCVIHGIAIHVSYNDPSLSRTYMHIYLHVTSHAKRVLLCETFENYVLL